MAGTPKTPDKSTWVPPYIAFTTLTDLLTRLEKGGGIPPQIDRSYLDSFSGAYQSQVIAALKSMALIRDNGEVTPQLVNMIVNAAERKRLIGEMVSVLYPAVVKLGEINATQAQLIDEFRKFGITGDTQRKAIAFYLKAAKYADIKTSPHFKVPAVGGSGTKLARPRKVKDTPLPSGGLPPAAPPELKDLDAALVAWLAKEPSWSGAKAAWFTTFKAIYKGLNPQEEIE
jgi:hypothetical protein